MVPATQPAAADDQQDNHSTVKTEVSVDCLMIGSAVTIAVLTVLSTYTRRSNHPILRFFLSATSQLTILLISYTISRAANVPSSELLVLSAVFLQLIVKKIAPKKVLVSDDDTDDSFKFRDGDPVEQLAYVIWIGFLLFTTEVPRELSIPIWLTWAVICVKMSQDFLALKLARRSYALGKNAKLVACYMDHLQRTVESGGQTNFMSGYPYLVMGEEKQKIEPSAKGYRIRRSSERERDLITVDKIWACKGELLLKDKRLRELCLSFALFKLLRRRFERRPLAESNTRKALDLVLHGPLGDEKVAFRIIEDELAFLNDYLFSPLPFTYFGWFPISNIFLFVVLLSGCGWVGVGVIKSLIDPNKFFESYYQEYFQNNNNLRTETVRRLLYLDASVFLTIMVVILFIEIWEIETYVSSDWAKVVLVSKYVKNPNPNLCLCKVLKQYCHRKGIFKPRFYKLRQYSLLEDRKERSIKVPDEVKEAIVTSLKNNDGRLTTGEESLRRNVVTNQEMLRACRIRSNTKRILVWHIATSLCEYQEGGQAIVIDSSNHKVASRLSRYCAYLVASVPELLPDDIHWTQSIVKRVIKEARSILKGHSGPVSKLNGMNQEVVYDEDDEDDPSEPIDVILMGARLWRPLMGMNEAQRWQVLADLWAEMMLYLAPSDAVDAHAQRLEKGGEFITLVWALLSHAGINDRPEPNQG